MKLKFLALAAVLAATCAAQAQDKWIIGQSAPLTGGNAVFGNDIRNGANAWFAVVNSRGGVQGRPVELVTLDDKNDRKTAGANAKDLLERKDLLALFGYASATLSLDAIPQATAKSVPFFAPFSGANPVRVNNPVLFTMRASYGEEMEKMLNFWTSLGFKRVSVVHYDDEVGRENLGVVVAYLKKINLAPQALALKRNAVVGKAEAEKLVSQQPQLVINTTLSGAAAALQKELVAMGRMVPTSSLSFVGADQFIKAAGTAGSGVSIAQVVPSPTSALPAVRECAKAVEALTGKPMNTTQLEACFGARVLVEGIRRAKKPVNAQTLLEALSNLGTFDLGGYKVTFAPGAQHGSKYVDLAMVTRDGRLTTQ
ncbi:ABC transporter substrate-binding protein [Ramlibacter sp.]|uniref:ABC transporter substrate-binding protein n=1 Tax=Ramlibacter sp. TaxID=1917967 RepID=UPI003D0F47F5